MIDFIGDIHGHATELRALLKKLGYVERGGVFAYPGNARKVVFLGDYIDRGSESRETIDLVRAMRDAGAATALMGNHEFNTLCFWQQNGAGGGHFLKTITGGYLRDHSFNKVAILARTVESYRGRQQEFHEMLDFLKTLPFYMETDLFRAQHACYDAECVQTLREAGITSFADGNFDELIARACDSHNEFEDSLFHPLDILLKGPEMELPAGGTFRDGEGVVRKKMRLRWWIDPKNATLQDIALQPGVDFSDEPVPEPIRSRKFYGENERPVFFGHYWLKGEPALIRKNVCCLDYSIGSFYGHGRMVAYRFDGEQTLDARKFVWVEGPSV